MPAFQLPRLATLARQGMPKLFEGVLIPLGIFYAVLAFAGVWGALLGALAWSYLAILVRMVARRPVPGLLVVGALGLTARTAIAAATGSVFVYFLQPSLGNVAVAGAFLATFRAGRPLAQRLAADFMPLPPELVGHPGVKRFFLQISLLWGVAMLANAAMSVWLLVTQPVSTFVLTRTLASVGLMGLAVGVSVWWFRRSMTRYGVKVSFG